jgi:hypothetical protein
MGILALFLYTQAWSCDYLSLKKERKENFRRRHGDNGSVNGGMQIVVDE